MTATNLLDGMSILIVEDEVLVAMQLTRIIQDLGARVLGPVSTVNAGIELLHSSLVHGAVLDLNLGKESSASLAEQLIASGIPLVITTGYSDDVLPDALAKVPRLSKPYAENAVRQIAAACFIRS
jgi:DNA-binding NarL/FixJ family response regulator